MRVVLVHNYYGSSAPSGENEVFDIECELLRSRGHDTVRFVKHNDELANLSSLGIVKLGIKVPWNRGVADELLRLVRETQPDIVHVHNTFPQISPAIFRSIHVRVPVVMTLHNYRLFCAKAIPLRDGKSCTRCLGSSLSWPALRYACYRGSVLATLPVAAAVSLHRMAGTWRRYVDRFIALTEFQKSLMLEAGVPCKAIGVRPNWLPGQPLPVPWRERSKRVVFAGRLSTEKGVHLLVEAWRRWGRSAPELWIVGDGPLMPELRRTLSGQATSGIRLLGMQSANATREIISQSWLVLVPSIWFEGFPLVVREAFALGTPVASSDIGALKEIVVPGVNGIRFPAGNVEEMQAAVSELWTNPEKIQHLGRGARSSFETKYSEEVAYASLMSIYEHTIRERQLIGVDAIS